MPDTRRLLTLAFCMALSTSAANCRAATPGYDLTDLTGAYVAFFDRTQSLATDARVIAFKAEMSARFPGFYDASRMPEVSPAQYDADIARSFADFPVQRAAFVRTAASFRSMLRPALQSFVDTFTDFHSVGHIALVHSLGEMDGGTRTIKGQTYLAFGADVMAKLIAPGRERPFFHHELFHAYNAQYFGECEALWCTLWMEGLAVYVSEQLNTGATDADLLLTSPRPIRAAVDANLARAVCAVRAQLDSTAQRNYAAFFFGSSSFEDLPPRAGYYIGYLALKQLGKSHSLRDLAHRNQQQARPALQASLDRLAECPAVLPSRGR